MLSPNKKMFKRQHAKSNWHVVMIPTTNFSNDEAIRVLIKIYTVGFLFYILSE